MFRQRSRCAAIALVQVKTSDARWQVPEGEGGFGPGRVGVLELPGRHVDDRQPDTECLLARSAALKPVTPRAEAEWMPFGPKNSNDRKPSALAGLSHILLTWLFKMSIIP